jgi:hypothetical protein
LRAVARFHEGRDLSPLSLGHAIKAILHPGSGAAVRALCLLEQRKHRDFPPDWFLVPVKRRAARAIVAR